MIKLKKQFSIQLMKEDNEGHPLNRLNNDVITMLSKEYGGTTVTEVAGTWTNDNGELFQDHSLMVSVSYSSGVDLNGFKKAIAKEFIDGKQLAVIVRINEVTYILESLIDIDEINF